jgi:hypothetical protein
VTVHQLFVDFEKTYDSARRDVLYVINEYGIPLKPVRLIKVYLNETYIKSCIDKNLADAYNIRNCLKQGDGILLLSFNFALEHVIRKVQENQKGMEHISYWSVIMSV